MSQDVGDVIHKVLLAAQAGHLDVLRQAVKEHDSEDHEISMCRNKAGDTPMLIASRHGHLGMLEYLHERLMLSLEQANLDHKRCLHEAAAASQLKCVQYLLKHGVQVDSLKRADWTPLMLACTKHNLAVVQAMVAAGADVRLCNKDGWTPFHLACREENEEIVEFLLSNNPRAWDTRSKNGRTPLHTAALHCRLNVVHILLERGRYVADGVDSCGITPLMDAARACSSSHYIPLLDVLVEQHHASISVCDSLGRSALHHAAQNGCHDAVRHLVNRHGADPSAPSSAHAMTPLHYAAKEGQLKTVKLLVELGVDVNGADFKGRAALHMAAIGKHLDVVRFLRVDCQAEDLAGGSNHRVLQFLPRHASKSLLDLFTLSG